MEKSIESIWKNGFLNQQAMVAPKVNDLYNQKSAHLIDKFKRMFKINIWAIAGGATFLFLGSLLIGAWHGGSVLFVMLMYIAWSAQKDLEGLKEIDKGQSSYAYLKSFKGWLNDSMEKYGTMYRVVYPVMILAFYFGMWFSDLAEPVREMVAESPEQLFHGVHIYSTIPILIAAVTMSMLSKRIHREDVKSLYGGIIKKLDELLADMEELSEN